MVDLMPTSFQRRSTPLPSDAAIRRAARYYATHYQWTLALVHGVEQGSCTCGRSACDRIGKHPWPIDGHIAVSNDADVVDQWLAERPGANIGLATGRSGIVVVEFDLRMLGADVSHDDLTEQYPVLRDAPCVFSGGGSRHYYFAQPAEVAIGFHVARLSHAVDILGGPAIATLPPSIHRSGRWYVWEAGLDVRELEVPMLEGGLLAAIVALDRSPQSTGARALATLPRDHISRRVSIVSLAKRLGFRPDRDSKIRCPLDGHDDRRPSFVFNAKLNSYACWSHPGGAVTGGLLSFVERLGYAQGVAASAAFAESLFPEA